LKLDVDSNNLIQGFVKNGDNPACTIEIDDSKVPDGFAEAFKPNYYLYQNGVIGVNPNYSEPNQPISQPSAQQTINANLMLQIATLTAEVSKLKGSAS
jgi:hypothetical protein